jgi:dipeptidyl aminopeptidase/acylaminoacyl peptidase
MGIRSIGLCLSALGFVLIGKLGAQTPSTLPQQVAEGERPEGKMSAGRPIEAGDIFSIRKYGATVASPDGQSVAIEIKKWARGVSGEYNADGNSNHRTELWVASRNGQKQQRLTPERPAQLSQWNPVWSPNSRQFAFLSNEGQGNAFLEVWDRGTGRVRRLAKMGVDLEASITRTNGKTFSWDSQNQMLWLDATHLLVMLLPPGLRSARFDGVSISPRIVSAGLDDVASGVKSTGIVASSPPRPSDLHNFPQAQLVIFDTTTGASHAIAAVPAWLGVGRRHIVLSPNAERAVIVITIPNGAIDPQEKWGPRQLQWTKLGIASLKDPRGGVRWVDRLQPALVNGTDTTLRWRSGDASFTIVGQQPGANKMPYLADVNAISGEWHLIADLDENRLGSDERMEVLNIAWLEDGRVAVRVHHPRTTDDALRITWWTVSGENATRLTKEEETQLKDNRPADPKFETSETGRLYQTDAAGHETTIFPELNPQLAGIETPRSINFEYQSTTGEKLHAILLLPHGYVEGKRYPTVVWVYAGDVFGGDEKPPQRNASGFLELLFLTGRGYAVLRPSMPITPVGVPGDPMLHLNDGVDPAIDKAVSLGIVDPDRLAIAGHSYGGYSVLGLLTLTHRFRAGVALMGVSDLASFYGELIYAVRYTNPELAAWTGPHFAEWEQLRMGVPPWIDSDRYVRNSPFFAADKITTPLLLVEGDLDGAPSQSDKMFTALNRQGKRVEYVRYLGEAHGLQSPANILDLWQRIFSWLDTYVMGDPAEVQH